MRYEIEDSFNMTLSPSPDSEDDYAPASKRSRVRRSNKKSNDGRRNRTTFTPQQIALLDEFYLQNPYISQADRPVFAKKLGVRDYQVKTWFQNRRSKDRHNGVIHDAPQSSSPSNKRVSSTLQAMSPLPNKDDPPSPLSYTEEDSRPESFQSLHEELEASHLRGSTDSGLCGGWNGMLPKGESLDPIQVARPPVQMQYGQHDFSQMNFGIKQTSVPLPPNAPHIATEPRIFHEKQISNVSLGGPAPAACLPTIHHQPTVPLEDRGAIGGAIPTTMSVPQSSLPIDQGPPRSVQVNGMVPLDINAPLQTEALLLAVPQADVQVVPVVVRPGDAPPQPIDATPMPIVDAILVPQPKGAENPSSTTIHVGIPRHVSPSVGDHVPHHVPPVSTQPLTTTVIMPNAPGLPPHTTYRNPQYSGPPHSHPHPPPPQPYHPHQAHAPHLHPHHGYGHPMYHPLPPPGPHMMHARAFHPGLRAHHVNPEKIITVDNGESPPKSYTVL